MRECRFQMILDKKPAIPRSCPECGLGRCSLGLSDPWKPDAQKMADLEEGCSVTAGAINTDASYESIPAPEPPNGRELDALDEVCAFWEKRWENHDWHGLNARPIEQGYRNGSLDAYRQMREWISKRRAMLATADAPGEGGERK